MKTVTIPQKGSGTGSIHDLNSQHYDREIRFPRGSKYAVVLAAYYGDHYTTHRSEEATIREDRRQHEYSRQIIDSDGNYYDVVNGYPDRLVRR